MYSNFFGCKSTNSGRKIMLFLFLPPITEIRCLVRHPLYNLFSRRKISKKKITNNIYPCKPQMNYIKVEFEGWGEGLDNIRRLGWCILKHTYAKERTMVMCCCFFVSREDPYLRFLKMLCRCDKSRKYNILRPFWIFNTKPIKHISLIISTESCGFYRAACKYA